MRLLNVNKYFNKGKSNELHVLNNVSVDFPETGLVAIFALKMFFANFLDNINVKPNIKIAVYAISNTFILEILYKIL